MPSRSTACFGFGEVRHIAVDDEELGGPIRMQNVVGRFSRTPGAVRHAGPRLGSSNREVLVDQLGFDEDELKAAGISID